MTELNPPFLDTLAYPAKELRKILKDIFTEGILTSTSLQVTQHSTPAMSVDIASGRALVLNDGGNYGTYLIENNATVTKTIAASDPSNPRIDRVIAQVYDATDIGGAYNKWQIEVLTGTPAASPSAPALPDNALDLALVVVVAGATSIVNANITDQRIKTSSNLFVDLSSNQTIGGIKTFSSYPVTPGGQLSAGLVDKTRHINLFPIDAIIPASAGAEKKQVNGTYHSYYALAFDPNNNELAFWHSDVPEKYSGGAIKIKISCITTVTSGNVMFRVYTRGCGENETWDNTTDQTYGSVTKAVSGTAGNKFTAEITIPDPKWTYGDTIYLALNRVANDVNDTANADISVVMATVDYEVV